MMSGTELKSCPFCGSINVGFEDVGEPGEFQDFAVTCSDCGALFHQSTDGEVQSMEEVAAAWNRRDASTAQVNARAEFMGVVYDELSDDADNCRANRIIDAADEYTESCAGKVLPIPCTNVEGKSVKCWFQKINEELDELKEGVLVRFKTCDDADAWAKYSRQAETNIGNIALEAADTITSITSMLEAMGIDEEARQAAQKQVNEKNRKRGRF